MEFADYLEVSFGTVNRWENGKFTPAEDLWGVYPPDLIQNN